MEQNWDLMRRKCAQLRGDVLQMITEAGSGHPGGSLSMVEMLVALYYRKMNIDPENPMDPTHDRFVLSKGHAAPVLYAVLADKGYFPREELRTFRQLGSRLQGHPDKTKLPGIDASTGSLGQGISIAVGMALGVKLREFNAQIYTIVGDGELQEGLVWEAAMAASHYHLDNLTVLVDNNGLQIDGKNDDVLSLGNIGEKFQAFGFDVIDVEDGNDLEKICGALDIPHRSKPKCIVAHTVKGSGISFMEGVVGWHGKAPSNEEFCMAIEELKERM